MATWDEWVRRKVKELKRCIDPDKQLSRCSPLRSDQSCDDCFNMPIVSLRRDALESSKIATFGSMVIVPYWLITSELSFRTLEPPWLDNHKNISCIPEGSYYCVRTDKINHKNVFELQEVPDRKDILIHVGNSVADTQGCFLIGYKRDGDNIRLSKIAYIDFMKELANVNTFKLFITRANG